jgi:hypothetical protein
VQLRLGKAGDEVLRDRHGSQSPRVIATYVRVACHGLPRLRSVEPVRKL